MANRRKQCVACKICGFTGGKFRTGLCNKCYNSEYYKRNRQKIIEYAKLWCKNNPEKRNKIARDAANRRWHNLTDEEKLIKSRNQEKRRSPEEKKRRNKRVKEWYEKEKNTDRAKDRNKRCKDIRRARMYGVKCTLTKKEWEIIKKTYGYKCAYCGCDSMRLTQDHFIPISKGGNHTADNIVPACMPCNRKKWNRLPDDTFIRKEVIF